MSRILAVAFAIMFFFSTAVAAVCGYGWYRTSAKLAGCETAALQAAVEELAAIKAAAKKVAPKPKLTPKPAPSMAPCAPTTNNNRCSQEDPILRDACERMALRQQG